MKLRFLLLCVLALSLFSCSEESEQLEPINEGWKEVDLGDGVKAFEKGNIRYIPIPEKYRSENTFITREPSSDLKTGGHNTIIDGTAGVVQLFNQDFLITLGTVNYQLTCVVKDNGLCESITPSLQTFFFRSVPGDVFTKWEDQGSYAVRQSPTYVTCNVRGRVFVGGSIFGINFDPTVGHIYRQDCPQYFEYKGEPVDPGDGGNNGNGGNNG